MRKAYVFKERQRYSIRKYSFGAASVLIGASLMLGGHALAQEQANSTSTSKDYEVFVNNSEPLQIDQATSEAVTDVLNQPASRSEAPRPKLASSEVASSEASSVVASEAASLEVPAEVAHSASAVATVSRSEVASPRSEVSSVASSEAASETNRSATSEVAEVRGTDREAVDTPQPGVDGPVTADGSLDIPSNGTFYFRRTTEIRTAPIMDIKPTFVFSAGDHVIYDKVLKRDNHQWISYLGYDYVRYYADVATLTPAKAETPTVKPTETNQAKPEVIGAEKLPASGTYNVTRSLNVKNEPKASAETLYTLEKGYKVNYDKVLTADNHQWISYISYSGTRRYVDIATLKATESKPQENRVSGNLTINNQTSNGFDVVVTNVSGGGKEVKEVRVPIWSDKNGQDDLTWYHADKQSDGSYKVHVDTASHKGDAGTYSVHLYYMLDGKRTYITETTATVPQITETQVTGKLTNNGSYYSVRGKYDDIIIVNKKHGLSKDYNPGENPTAKAAFVRLRDDMINQGLNVGRSYSGFRSYDYQKTLYDNYVSRDGQAAADRYSARPGYSEHQTGLVFDLTDKSGNLLEDSRASQWLKDNAHNYGFIVRFQAGKEASTGYMPEAWHIRYVGKEAKDIHDSGLSLEEYFGIEGGDYAASSNPAESNPATTGAINLPATGTYTFTGRASIKAEAKVSSPELAYYDKGMTVNYDKVLTADGRQWLSYVTTSGARRYVDIAAAKAEAKPEVKPVAKPADKPSLPESGRYTFTGRASIKAEAKVSSPELAYYDKGMSVNYDKVLTADGHQWLSYMTASGARRYVDIA